MGDAFIPDALLLVCTIHLFHVGVILEYGKNQVISTFHLEFTM